MLIRAAQKVVNLQKLPDNWDGRGSPAPQDRAIEKALSLLQYLEVEDPPEPRVGPVPGGGLQMEWDHNDRGLELEIFPDGSVQI